MKGWAVFKFDTYFTPTNSYEENISHICRRILGIQIWLNVIWNIKPLNLQKMFQKNRKTKYLHLAEMAIGFLQSSADWKIILG